MDSLHVYILGLLFTCQVIQGADDTYSAVVVEYSPATDPSVDADTNILNNVANYVQFIDKAATDMMADIIVFPEIGLKGYYNQPAYMEVPDPKDEVVLCAHNTTYEAPLVQLSCAARATSTYLVINLGERFYNTSLERTFFFNTDVVFDRSGVVIARYRKIHLFGEKGRSPSPDGELGFFDTDFGVRFGLMICFDIVFQDPGLVLAETYNVSHFIFTSGWFSEMPFLSAIQEQHYWSYTVDAVLLAAGYNLPSVGSTGSGIYMGRQGPVAYKMTETRGSFMIHANLPKQTNLRGTSGFKGVFSLEGTVTEILQMPGVSNTIIQEPRSPSQIKMKRDFLDVYTTEQITLPAGSNGLFNESGATVHFNIDNQICQNSLCCNFSVGITTVFSNSGQNVTRGDDYSQLYYRLAVFDGVRNYDDFATGGLQTCAIIPCVNTNIQSCGLRSDDPSAIPNTHLGTFYQTEFIFTSISIAGNFSSNNSFVGPNALLQGTGDDFGSLLLSKEFSFNISNDLTSFQTLTPIQDLVVASVYGRIFSRDGQIYTGSPKERSSGFNAYVDIFLLVTALIMLTYSLT
uniref:CN hydrolase domain-containing protein n=1 Tax=Cuerna arida TaxID=1464854 RepID=A0A1B6G7K1_9HEMI